MKKELSLLTFLFCLGIFCSCNRVESLTNDQDKTVTLNIFDGNNNEQTAYYSLNAAFDHVYKTIKNSEDDLKISISLSEKSYILNETILFDGEDFLNKNYEISLIGKGKDKTIISSNQYLDYENINELGQGQYSYTFQKEDFYNEIIPSLHDFYIDNQLVKMAHSKEYNLQIEPKKYQDSNDNTSGTVLVDSSERKIYLHEEVFKRDNGKLLTSEEIKGTELWIKNVWKLHGLRLKGFDPHDAATGEDGSILYAAYIYDDDWMRLMNDVGYGVSYTGTLKGNCYYLTNNLAYLKENNTFVYDYQEGTIYFQIDEESDLQTHTYSYPLLDNLLELKNAKNISIYDIGFLGTTNSQVLEKGYLTQQAGVNSTMGNKPYGNYFSSAAIYGENLKNIQIENCSFKELGYDGISFRGAVDDIKIKNNYFFNISSAAIRLAEAYGNTSLLMFSKDHHYQNLEIENNYIENTGIFYYSSPAIQVGHVRNLKLLHNTIRHSSYSGISLGWGWRPISDELINLYNVEVAYNFIDGFMCDMQDGAAIYVMGGNASKNWVNEYFNTIHDNYCVVSQETGKIHGINDYKYSVLYLDASSTNWDVYQNVIHAEHLTNQPKYNYIYMQNKDSQQAYNCRAINNAVVNLLDEKEILGGTKEGLENYGLIFENNYALKDYGELEERFPNGKNIITNSGCDNSHSEWIV